MKPFRLDRRVVGSREGFIPDGYSTAHTFKSAIFNLFALFDVSGEITVTDGVRTLAKRDDLRRVYVWRDGRWVEIGYAGYSFNEQAYQDAVAQL